MAERDAKRTAGDTSVTFAPSAHDSNEEAFGFDETGVSVKEDEGQSILSRTAPAGSLDDTRSPKVCVFWYCSVLQCVVV